MYMNRHAVVVVAASIGSILSPGLVLHGLEKKRHYIKVSDLCTFGELICVCVCVSCVIM